MRREPETIGLCLCCTNERPLYDEEKQLCARCTIWNLTEEQTDLKNQLAERDRRISELAACAAGPWMHVEDGPPPPDPESKRGESGGCVCLNEEGLLIAYYDYQKGKWLSGMDGSEVRVTYYSVLKWLETRDEIIVEFELRAPAREQNEVPSPPPARFSEVNVDGHD